MSDRAHPEIEARADVYRRYYRTIDPAEAVDGLCLRLASGDLLENRLSAMLAEARTEIARLRRAVPVSDTPPVPASFVHDDDPAAAPSCHHCGKPATGGVTFMGGTALCSEPCYGLVDEGHPATALRPGRGPCPDCAYADVLAGLSSPEEPR
jgi:hypothetical protein